jgi:phage gp29-like protein
MPEVSALVDQFGRPIVKEVLTRAVAGPSVTGVRSPISGYPADGLNPRRLANLLRDADQADPLRYFELAEQVEERDLHYAGVLGTRKRSVSQLDITVTPAGEDADSKADAAMIQDWVSRDELQLELFDILDAIGKGVSFTEIVWDTSEGQWLPKKLEWRDPRWFRFDRVDGATPLLRDADGDVPLQPFKFITATIKAKSGLPVRSGLARIVAWAYMFKKYTERDWAIFTQTFGQPIRVGKYPPGATETDKDTLFSAVANIAGDCAAIVPAGMDIEFVTAENVSAGSDLYLKRADWFDKQVSKAVLGQTSTTDAETGGLGSGDTHRQVQEDIETADCKALAAILNRDLIQPWIQLERGPQKKYPRVSIGRPDEENTTPLIDGIAKVVPLGVKVGAKFVREKLGIPEPEAGDELLVAPAQTSPFGFGPPALQAQRSPQRSAAEIAAIAAAAERLAQPATNDLIGDIRTALQAATSLADLKQRLASLKLEPDKLASAVQVALMMAQLAGRADIADAV